MSLGAIARKLAREAAAREAEVANVQPSGEDQTVQAADEAEPSMLSLPEEVFGEVGPAVEEADVLRELSESAQRIVETVTPNTDAPKRKGGRRKKVVGEEI